MRQKIKIGHIFGQNFGQKIKFWSKIKIGQILVQISKLDKNQLVKKFLPKNFDRNLQNAGFCRNCPILL